MNGQWVLVLIAVCVLIFTLFANVGGPDTDLMRHCLDVHTATDGTPIQPDFDRCMNP